jgi:hypothetical protein
MGLWSFSSEGPVTDLINVSAFVHPHHGEQANGHDFSKYLKPVIFDQGNVDLNKKNVAI